MKKGYLEQYIDFVLKKRGDEDKKIMYKFMCDDGKGFFKVSVCLIPIEESSEKQQNEPDNEVFPSTSNIQNKPERRSQRFIELGQWLFNI